MPRCRNKYRARKLFLDRTYPIIEVRMTPRLN